MSLPEPTLPSPSGTLGGGSRPEPTLPNPNVPLGGPAFTGKIVITVLLAWAVLSLLLWRLAAGSPLASAPTRPCEADPAASTLLSLALGLNNGTGYQTTVVCK